MNGEWKNVHLCRPLIEDSRSTAQRPAEIVKDVPHEEPTPIPRKPRGTMDTGMIGTLRRPKKLGTAKNSVDQVSEEQDKLAEQVVNGSNGLQPANSEEEVSSMPKIVTDSLKRDEAPKIQQIEKIPETKDISGPVNVAETNLPSYKSSENVTSLKSPNQRSISSRKTDYEKTDQNIVFQSNSRVSAKINHQTAPSRGDDSSSRLLENLPIEQLKIVSSPEKPKIISRISREKLEDVRVVFSLEDSTIWVNKCEDVPKLESLMLELSLKVDKWPKVENIVVGGIYAVQYEGIWHRVVILSKTPIILSYIDFGNEEPPQSNDFRLVKEFADHPGYAIRLRLSPNCKRKNFAPDEVFSVKMIGIDQQGIVEVIDHEDLPKTEAISAKPQIIETTKMSESVKVQEEEKSSGNLRSSLDNLELNETGFLQVFVSLDEKSYAACVLSTNSTSGYEMVYDSLGVVCNQSEKPENFSPNIGSFVCGKRGDAWLRGHVVALGPPIRLALVDEARVAPVEEITPMPSGYEKIECFGAIVELENANAKLNPEETGQFTVTEIRHEDDARVVKAIFSTPESINGLRFTIKNWKPTAEQKGIALAELNNNSEVKFSFSHLGSTRHFVP